MKTINCLDSIETQTLSTLSDFKIEQIFKEARYHKTEYKPYCPKCGSEKKSKDKKSKFFWIYTVFFTLPTI